MAKRQDKLALLGLEQAGAEWWPSIRATAEGAHSLTQAIVTMAHHALEEERREGSEIPPLTVKQRDPETGEMKDVLNLAYEAVLRERALYYLQSLKLEADASTLEILADIFQRQLYMHHPDQWGSLADFLRNMAAGKSASYQSVVERLVTIIIPFLQVEKLATVREMMELITEGGMSNLYHLLPELVSAAEGDNAEAMAELLNDAKSLGRSEIFDKYKRDSLRILPARSTLTQTNPGWQLIIEMTEAQKSIILNRLGRRIAYE